MPVVLSDKPEGYTPILFLNDGSERIFSFDASINEIPQKSGLLTKHPAQEGIPINDNFRRDPYRIVLDAIITDTPLGVDPATVAEDRSRKLYLELSEIWLKGISFTLVLHLDVFDDMLITSLSAPTNSSVGAEVIFNMVIEERRIANTQDVLAPERLANGRGDRGSGTSDGGTQQGKDVPESQKGSLLFRGNTWVDNNKGINIAKAAGLVARGI